MRPWDGQIIWLKCRNVSVMNTLLGDSSGLESSKIFEKDSFVFLTQVGTLPSRVMFQPLSQFDHVIIC